LVSPQNFLVSARDVLIIVTTDSAHTPKSDNRVAGNVRYVVTSCECDRLARVMTCEVLFIRYTLPHCTPVCKVAVPTLVIEHH
jgi:hypothetical protein